MSMNFTLPQPRRMWTEPVLDPHNKDTLPSNFSNNGTTTVAVVRGEGAARANGAVAIAGRRTSPSTSPPLGSYAVPAGQSTSALFPLPASSVPKSASRVPKIAHSHLPAPTPTPLPTPSHPPASDPLSTEPGRGSRISPRPLSLAMEDKRDPLSSRSKISASPVLPHPIKGSISPRVLQHCYKISASLVVQQPSTMLRWYPYSHRTALRPL